MRRWNECWKRRARCGHEGDAAGISAWIAQVGRAAEGLEPAADVDLGMGFAAEVERVWAVCFLGGPFVRNYVLYAKGIIYITPELLRHSQSGIKYDRVGILKEDKRHVGAYRKVYVLSVE